MTLREEVFKNNLGKIIRSYCPNEACLDIISSHLYRLALEALGDVNIGEEKADLGDWSPMTQAAMEMSFKKALKDVVLFSSQDILQGVIKESFLSVRNLIPLANRDSAPSKVRSKESTVYSSNEASFDMMDLDEIPKVDPSIIAKAVQTQVSMEGKKRRVPRNDSNEFEGDFEMDYEDINKKSSPNVKKDVGSNTSNNEEDKVEIIQDFATDASAFTSEVLEDEPKFVFDMDY
jgi:hypothetical protein